MTSRAVRTTATFDPATDADLVAYARATDVDPPPDFVELVMATIARTPAPRRRRVWSWASVRAAWSSTPRPQAAAALVVLVMAATAGVALAVARVGSVGGIIRDDSPAIVVPSERPLSSQPAPSPTSTAAPTDMVRTSAAPLIAAPTATTAHPAKTPSPTAPRPHLDGDGTRDDDDESTDGERHDRDSGDTHAGSTDSPDPTDSPESTERPSETDEPSDPE